MSKEEGADVNQEVTPGAIRDRDSMKELNDIKIPSSNTDGRMPNRGSSRTESVNQSTVSVDQNEIEQLQVQIVGNNSGSSEILNKIQFKSTHVSSLRDTNNPNTLTQLHQNLIDTRNDPNKIQLDMSVNKCFVATFLFVINLPGILNGYVMAYQNQLQNDFVAKFGWTDDNKGWYEGLLGAAIVLGLAVGAASGGKIITIGRRKAVILAAFIGIAGCAITQYRNLYTILGGRFLFGVSSGIQAVAVPRLTQETLPKHLYDSLSPLFMVGQSIGTLAAFGFGYLLPPNTDTKDLMTDQVWRISYAYFPISVNLANLIGMFLLVKYDSVKYLIVSDQIDEAKLAVQQLYKGADTAEMVMVYIDNLRANSSKSSSGCSLIDSLCNPKYRRATWVSIGYIFFHEVSGINVIMLYSTTIFQNLQASGSTMSPRTGTFYCGIVNMLGNLCCLWTISKFGRKTLLIAAHVSFAVSHFLVGYFNNIQYDVGVMWSIFAFLFIYQQTSGPIAWLYATETTIDIGLGLCLLSLYVDVFVLSLICPIFLQKTSSVGPSNVFFIFSGLSVIGVVFVIAFIRETKGLTDKDKKNVFTPKQYLEKDRKVEVDESEFK